MTPLTIVNVPLNVGLTGTMQGTVLAGELERAHHERHQQVLREALTDLDTKLEELG